MRTRFDVLVHSEQLCKGVLGSTRQWGWTEVRTPVRSCGAVAPYAAFHTPQRSATATPAVLQRSCPGTARWAWSRARARWWQTLCYAAEIVIPTRTFAVNCGVDVPLSPRFRSLTRVVTLPARYVLARCLHFTWSCTPLYLQSPAGFHGLRVSTKTNLAAEFVHLP